MREDQKCSTWREFKWATLNGAGCLARGSTSRIYSYSGQSLKFLDLFSYNFEEFTADQYSEIIINRAHKKYTSTFPVGHLLTTLETSSNE